MVSGQEGIREIGATLDRESVVSTLSGSESRANRDRDQHDVRPLRETEKLHRILERKVDSAVQGEEIAQRKFYESEAEVEARNCEKRNSDMAFQEFNQEFEAQRFQLHQASQWADQAQRDKISLYGELELRNQIFREDHESC